jgi:SNF2 family DNA or RNA helicase
MFSLSPPERELYDRVAQFVRRVARPSKGQNPRQWYFTLLVLQKEMGSSVHAAQKTLQGMIQKRAYLDMADELEDLNQLALSINTSAKLDQLLALLSRANERVIIFTQFKRTLDYLRAELEKRGEDVSLFHGELSLRQKERAIIEFRKQKRILVSTEAGGEGHNLHFCRTIINYDLPWNPMKIEQRIGRVHRLGQTQDVNVFNLSTEDTVESYVLEILDRKINMFQLVVGEVDLILGNLKDARSFEDSVFKIWAGTESRRKLQEGFRSLGDKLSYARRQYEKVKELDAKLFNGRSSRR